MIVNRLRLSTFGLALGLAFVLVIITGKLIASSLSATGEPTPTSTPSIYPAPPPSFLAPSVTPYPIGNVIDLAPNMPGRCKAEVIVLRNGGQIEKFLVPIGEDFSRVKANLGATDKIINAAPPAASMGHFYVATITADGKIQVAPPPTPECLQFLMPTTPTASK